MRGADSHTNHVFVTKSVELRPFEKIKNGEFLKFRAASFEKKLPKSAPREAAGAGDEGGQLHQ